MVDLLNNSAMLGKLGVDCSNQWIIYDKQFEKLFTFLSENVSDCNIFTTQELFQRSDLISLNKGYHEKNQIFKHSQIKSNNPGIVTYTQQYLKTSASRLAVLRKTSIHFLVLLKEMQNNKQSLNYNLSLMESTALSFHILEREIQMDCRNRARQVEEVQRENCKLSDISNQDFTEQQIPPFFMHQLRLEQYFHKCDLFMQNFILYMKENFKIRASAELTDTSIDMQHFNNIENLPTTFQHYKLSFMKEKSKAKATEALIDLVAVNQSRCIRLADMKRESQDLQSLNDNYLKNSYETLINALEIQIQQHIQHTIELVLFDNTKQKVERACYRRKNDKQLANLISKALTNAEIIWIGIQIDLDRKRNSTDSFLRLYKEVPLTWGRVKETRSLYASFKGTCHLFLHKMSTQFKQNDRSDKNCLYSYDKFGKLLILTLHNMLNNKSYIYLQENLNELYMIEQTVYPLVYDSPLKQPIFENIQYLCPIFNLVEQQKHFTEQLRHLRTQFWESILERMNNEKLWRYRKLLWTWFLTDPQCLFNAIDEVKRLSAIPALTNNVLRPGGGLQRK